MTEPTYGYRELTSAYIELKDERDDLLLKIAALEAELRAGLKSEDIIEFADHMFWTGVDWEGGVQATKKCVVDAELRTALQAWNEKQK
jgi:hypothetical protein